MIRKVNDADTAALSSLVGNRGIRTAADFLEFMGALMTDVVEGNVSPDEAQAALKAGELMLRIIEIQYGFGKDL